MYKILALKERPEWAHALTDLIEPHGYKVLVVGTIEEALATLHREQVDMVIAAVHLEKGSIFDLIRAIRVDSNSQLRKVPIVCININPGRCANYFNESLEIAAKALGADRFITMPEYDAAKLWKQIESMLPDAGGLHI